MTVLGVVLVTIAQVWVVSAGWMNYWPQYTTHYNRLAEAFRRGQCSLLFKPDPAQLALADPYDPVTNSPYRLRAGVHDTILYNGKFYLCWGPVPALLLVPVKVLAGRCVIGDQYLVYTFAFGAMLFSALLLRSLWGRFFADVPPWMLLLAIVTAGLSTPLPYTLARSAVYEAAILGGQCFLLAGLYAVCGGKHFPGRLRLALAGTCWALAAGSRVSLAIALAGLSALVAWRIILHGWRQSRRFDFASLAAFAMPLAAGAALLGAYNVARFGNWHEFGQRFQLTNNNNYHSIPRLFQPANAVPGMYSYFLRPIQLHNQFPFVEAKPGDGRFPSFIRLPAYYEYNEPIAGLLIVTPFIWLALVPACRLVQSSVGKMVRHRIAWESVASSIQDPASGLLLPLPAGVRAHFRQFAQKTLTRSTGRGDQNSVADSGLNWSLLCLLTASLLGFAPIPFMLGSTMRYLCDLTPCLMIVAGIGLWQRARDTAAGRPGRRRMFRAIAGTLAAWSIVIGMLLSVTGYYQHFFHFHRHLFGHISYWAQEFGE